MTAAHALEPPVRPESPPPPERPDRVTGDPDVDAALDPLRDAEAAPIEVQAEVYADVARSLQRVLDGPQP